MIRSYLRLPRTLSSSVAVLLILVSGFSGASEAAEYPDFLLEHLERSAVSTETSDPPVGPVISLAEWEPATGVLINYPLGIPVSLLVAFSEDTEVVSVVNDEQMMNQALDEYAMWGVELANCSFIFSGSDSDIWTRDHGPWYIFDGAGNLGVIDNEYDAGRLGSPTADDVPKMVGEAYGLAVYGTGLVTEGGNYMTDGMGTAFDLTWVVRENPRLRYKGVSEVYRDFLGITRHIMLPDALRSLHIDVIAKLLDPGRILVNTPDEPDERFEAIVEYLGSLKSAYGRPYEIVRVKGEGYSNSLILNDKVYVPMFGSPNDALALETYANAMPGYEVRGFLHAGSDASTHAFETFDALHCRTHEMMDPEMLRIVHVPLFDRENTGGDYLVEADFHPYSNAEMISGTPRILWRTGEGAYNRVSMTKVSGDTYQGFIPRQADGTYVEYYLYAMDHAGVEAFHPYVGARNPHRFFVGPDTQSPTVVFEPPKSILVSEWPHLLGATIRDDRQVEAPVLEYSINGGPTRETRMSLVKYSAIHYQVATAHRVRPGDVVDVRVRAVDTSVDRNTSFSPEYRVKIDGSLRAGSPAARW